MDLSSYVTAAISEAFGDTPTTTDDIASGISIPGLNTLARAPITPELRKEYIKQYRPEALDVNRPIGETSINPDEGINRLSDRDYLALQVLSRKSTELEKRQEVDRVEQEKIAEQQRLKNMNFFQAAVDPANLKRQASQLYQDTVEAPQALLAGLSNAIGQGYRGVGNLADLASLPYNLAFTPGAWDRAKNDQLPQSTIGSYINTFVNWGKANSDQIRSGLKNTNLNRLSEKIGHTAGDIINLGTTSRLTGGATSGFALYNFAQEAPNLISDPLKVAGKTLEGALMGRFIGDVNKLAPELRVPILFGTGTLQSAALGNDVPTALEDGVLFGGLGFLGGRGGFQVRDIKDLHVDPAKELKAIDKRISEVIDPNSEIGSMIKEGKEPFGPERPPEYRAELEGPRLPADQEANRQNLKDISSRQEAVLEDKPATEFLSKRGAQNVEMQDAHAEKIYQEHGQRIADEWRIGKSFNSAEKRAIVKDLVDTATETKQLAKEYIDRVGKSGAYSSEAVSFAEKLDQAYQRIAHVDNVIKSGSAESARALGDIKNIKAIQKRSIEDLQDWIEKLGGADKLPQLAKMLDAIKDPSTLGRTIRDFRKADALDKAIFYFINNILSGPRTHLANIIGNTGTMLGSVFETYGAAAIGSLRAAKQTITGKEANADRVYWRQANARASALVTGWVDTFQATARAFRENRSSDNVYKADVQAARSETQFNGPVGTIVGTPGRFLVAEDEAFKSIARRMHLREWSTHDGIRQGLSGKALKNYVEESVSNPTEARLKAAQEHSQYLTFQKKLGTVGSKFENLANAEGGRILKFVLPFVRTPANILKYAGERTPLGLLSKNVRAELDAGGARQDIMAGKILMGTSLLATAAYLTHAGYITGAGPSDPKLRNIWRSAGHMPYSIRIPGTETWVSYGRIDPFATLIGAAADTTYYLQNDFKKKDTLERLWATMITSFVDNVSNKSFLSGAINFAQIFDNSSPLRDSKSEKFGQQFAAAWMPFSSFIRQSNDSTVIGDSTVRDVRSLADKVRSITPFLSNDLPAKYDVLGREIKKDSRGLYISPIAYKTVQDNKLLETMLRLEVNPAPMDRRVVGVELPARTYAQMSQRAGTMFKNMMENLAASPEFESLPAFKKAELIKTALYKSRMLARMTTYAENPKLFEDINREKIKQKYRLGNDGQLTY